MDSAISDLVMLGPYGVGGAAVLGLIVRRVVAMHGTATARLSDDECLACGSPNVTAQMPGVYRCNTCGYEGGSGMAAAKAEQERAQVRAMIAAAHGALERADAMSAS